MSNSRCGPGSNPVLHRNVTTYCRRPVLTAQFIPAEESNSPSLRFYLLLFEIGTQVYGQILSEIRVREFDELPYIRSDPVTGSQELEYETQDSHDPLVVLSKALEGLGAVTDRVGGVEPILNSIEVIDENYIEVAADMVLNFGTPFSELRGKISQADIFPGGSLLTSNKEETDGDSRSELLDI